MQISMSEASMNLFSYPGRALINLIINLIGKDADHSGNVNMASRFLKKNLSVNTHPEYRNLAIMTCFKKPRWALTTQKYLFQLALALVICSFAIPVTLAVPVEDFSTPEHDDNGNPPPINKGTDNALCQSGVSSGFACRNVELMSRIPLLNMGGGTGADSWGWKDEQTGRYYALMTRSSGTSFIDVTDPASPLLLGNLPSAGGVQPWRDVKVYANHAFIVADNIPTHGMQVFDLTRLRGVTSPQVFTADTVFRRFGPAHNIAINEDSGFAYIVGSNLCLGGLYILDIRTPKAPSFAGCFSADGYTHDVQCVTYSGPDSNHQGDEICFASNEDSLTIVDVSNKAAPVMLSKIPYPLIGYSHQGWLDQNQGMFFMGDELDELNFGMNTRTLMFDVSDLANPVYAGAHQHGTSVIDHNLYVNGIYMYQANYVGGLRILRIDHGVTTTMTEVGYFDTEPDENVVNFAGAWSVYPFFDNGTILVSDLNNGLFVLQASLADDAAESAPINGRISGLWTSGGLNDQGITLYVDENDAGPFIFFTWFLYLNGEPFWLAGNTSFEYGVDEVSIPTQRLSGLEFVTPASVLANRENIGALTIHVHGCNDLHIEYSFEALGSRELDFQRLAGVQGRGCLP